MPDTRRINPKATLLELLVSTPVSLTVWNVLANYTRRVRYIVGSSGWLLRAVKQGICSKRESILL